MSHSSHSSNPLTAVATAVLAVLAAIGTLVDNKTASQILAAKNQAILNRTGAADAANIYQSHLIREQIYEAALAVNPSVAAPAREQLESVAREESAAARPYLQREQLYEQAVSAENDQAQRFTEKHDLYDVAVTLVEIAIAIVSIYALTSSTYLAGFGGLCAAAGIGAFFYALLR